MAVADAHSGYGSAMTGYYTDQSAPLLSSNARSKVRCDFTLPHMRAQKHLDVDVDVDVKGCVHVAVH